jgi:phosphoribosylaminoimidazole-succinocarboxamide synthase
MKLLHQGSVKDIYQGSPENELSSPESSGSDALLFRFSNRYSIFDWGQMPDAIPGKGAALAKMGGKLLQYLHENGYKTHFLRMGENPEDMIVKSVDVPRDNHARYRERPIHTLVPLEVIYRFGVPKGSSLLKKYKTEADWKNAGFDRAYAEGDDFTDIAIDVTTKLEKLDRPLTALEAQELSHLTPTEWKNLLQDTRTLAREIHTVFSRAGLKLWDGKFEFAFGALTREGAREFVLVDSIGLDEIRLTFDGLPLSKELLRQQYLNTEWYQNLEKAKKLDPVNFRKHCEEVLHSSPRPLSSEMVSATSTLYSAVADLILNENQAEVEALHKKLQQSLETLTRSHPGVKP